VVKYYIDGLGRFPLRSWEKKKENAGIGIALPRVMLSIAEFCFFDISGRRAGGGVRWGCAAED